MYLLTKEQRHREVIEWMRTIHNSLALRDIAEKFDVGSRTIRRDIDELISYKNAPWFISNNQLHIDPTRKGAIELHGQWFDRQELEALFVLNQVIELLSPGSLKAQLQPLENKIHKLLKNEVSGLNLGQFVRLIEIADREVDNTVFQCITQALSEQKQLQISFWNRETNLTRNRKISPFQLVRYKDNWKVDAWCHQKNALRTFSLEAIQSIQLIQMPVKKVTKQTIKDHFQSSYGIFAGKADKQAIIKFSPYIARWVKYEQWHPEQIGQWDIDGSYQLQIPYYKDEELLQDIIKYADQAEILAPAELRDKAKQKLQQALKKYQ
jgi:predicted DNA-binding transcriptional regulator YafY